MTFCSNNNCVNPLLFSKNAHQQERFSIKHPTNFYSKKSTLAATSERSQTHFVLVAVIVVVVVTDALSVSLLLLLLMMLLILMLESLLLSLLLMSKLVLL